MKMMCLSIWNEINFTFVSAYDSASNLFAPRGTRSNKKKSKNTEPLKSDIEKSHKKWAQETKS